MKKGSLKFSPKRDSKIVIKPKVLPKQTDTGYPSHSPSHQELMDRCIDFNSKPVVKLLHTTEKIKKRGHAFAVKMDRMFDRVCLDRTLLIKEKIECILGSE